MNVNFSQVSTTNFSLFDAGRTTELTGDVFSVERTTEDAGAVVFRVIFSTEKLRAGTSYTLQFQGYDLCGKLQSAGLALRYTRSHHSLSVLANCAATNDCIYYVNGSLTKHVVTLPDVEVNLVYVPLGYDFSAKIVKNALEITEIEKYQVVLGKRYSVRVPTTVTSISEDTRTIIEGMTI